MSVDNNDEADSNELRNLIAQQTEVQMQEHSFKNLKEEFAFWDKNPNRSTQPDTLTRLKRLILGSRKKIINLDYRLDRLDRLDRLI